MPSPVYRLFFDKGKIAVSVYLTLLTPEVRLLAMLATELPGAITC